MGDFLIIPCLNCIKITQKQAWRSLIYFAWMKSMYFREYVCRFSRKLHYFCILRVSHLNWIIVGQWYHRSWIISKLSRDQPGTNAAMKVAASRECVHNATTLAKLCETCCERVTLVKQNRDALSILRPMKYQGRYHFNNQWTLDDNDPPPTPTFVVFRDFPEVLDTVDQGITMFRL